MIATSMLNRQAWMTDDDQFDHVVKSLQRGLRLNDQNENHPYVEKFTGECNVLFVYGRYVLEEEADGKQFWVIYVISFRETPYQTIFFAGK